MTFRRVAAVAAVPAIGTKGERRLRAFFGRSRLLESVASTRYSRAILGIGHCALLVPISSCDRFAPAGLIGWRATGPILAQLLHAGCTAVAAVRNTAMSRLLVRFAEQKMLRLRSATSQFVATCKVELARINRSSFAWPTQSKFSAPLKGPIQVAIDGARLIKRCSPDHRNTSRCHISIHISTRPQNSVREMIALRLPQLRLAGLPRLSKLCPPPGRSTRKRRIMMRRARTALSPPRRAALRRAEGARASRYISWNLKKKTILRPHTEFRRAAFCHHASSSLTLERTPARMRRSPLRVETESALSELATLMVRVPSPPARP